MVDGDVGHAARQRSNRRQRHGNPVTPPPYGAAHGFPRSRQFCRTAPAAPASRPEVAHAHHPTFHRCPCRVQRPCRCGTDARCLFAVGVAAARATRRWPSCSTAHGIGGVITVVIEARSTPTPCSTWSRCMARAGDGVPQHDVAGGRHRAPGRAACCLATSTAGSRPAASPSSTASSSRVVRHRRLTASSARATCWASPSAGARSDAVSVGSSRARLGVSRSPAARRRRTSSRLGVGTAPRSTISS